MGQDGRMTAPASGDPASGQTSGGWPASGLTCGGGPASGRATSVGPASSGPAKAPTRPARQPVVANQLSTSKRPKQRETGTIHSSTNSKSARDYATWAPMSPLVGQRPTPKGDP